MDKDKKRVPNFSEAEITLLALENKQILENKRSDAGAKKKRAGTLSLRN